MSQNFFRIKPAHHYGLLIVGFRNKIYRENEIVESFLKYLDDLIYCEAANCQRRKLHDKIDSL